MKVLGLAPYFLDERRFRKFRPSTLLSVYNGMMLLMFLFSGLEMRVGNSLNENLENVYTFAAMMKSSPYVISHGCFLFRFLVKLLTFCTCASLSTVRFISLSILSTVTLIMWRRRYLCWCLYILWVPFWFVSDLKWKIIRNFVFVSLWLYQFCQ